MLCDSLSAPAHDTVPSSEQLRIQDWCIPAQTDQLLHCRRPQVFCPAPVMLLHFCWKAATPGQQHRPKAGFSATFTAQVQFQRRSLSIEGMEGIASFGASNCQLHAPQSSQTPTPCCTAGMHFVSSAIAECSPGEIRARSSPMQWRGQGDPGRQ